MFLRSRQRIKDGKAHEYFSLVETCALRLSRGNAPCAIWGELNIVHAENQCMIATAAGLRACRRNHPDRGSLKTFPDKGKSKNIGINRSAGCQVSLVGD
jgi:hypothetical protein